MKLEVVVDLALRARLAVQLVVDDLEALLGDVDAVDGPGQAMRSDIEIELVLK